MIKRICDKCEKEIKSIMNDEIWFKIKCDKMMDNCVYCGAGAYELCENCFNEFKSQFANNN